jgi:hypothetical protein
MSVASEFGWLLVECAWHLLIAALMAVVSPLLFAVQACRASGNRKSFKSILITGGNAGLGEALARAFAAPGVRLVLLARDEGKLSAVAQGWQRPVD